MRQPDGVPSGQGLTVGIVTPAPVVATIDVVPPGRNFITRVLTNINRDPSWFAQEIGGLVNRNATIFSHGMHRARPANLWGAP